MSLDDYSLSESERIFFEKAAMIIYEWLSDDEKLKFNSELMSEGFLGIDDLRVKDRFFRLFNFLEVKYIRVEKWIEEMFQYLEEINAMSKNDTKIKDIEITGLGDKSLRISEVVEKFSEGNLKGYFIAILRKLGLEQEYKRYIAKLEGIPDE